MLGGEHQVLAGAKARGVEVYESIYGLNIKPYLGQLSLGEVKPATVRTWRTKLLKDGRAEFVGGIAILAILAYYDGSRVYQAATAGGTDAYVPLAISAVLGAATILTVLLVIRNWKRMSIPIRRVALLAGVAWFVGMLLLVVATHRVRGFRLLYSPSKELNSTWLTVSVGYQTIIWIILLLVTATFMTKYLLIKRSGTGDETRSP